MGKIYHLFSNLCSKSGQSCPQNTSPDFPIWYTFLSGVHSFPTPSSGHTYQAALLPTGYLITLWFILPPLLNNPAETFLPCNPALTHPVVKPRLAAPIISHCTIMSHRVHTFHHIIYNEFLYTTHWPPILHTPAQTIFTAQFMIMSHNFALPRHITLHYTTQLHLITELHIRFLNFLQFTDPVYNENDWSFGDARATFELC